MERLPLLVSAAIATLVAGCAPGPSLKSLPVDDALAGPNGSYAAGYSAQPAPLAESVRIEDRKTDKLAKLIGTETTFGTPTLPEIPNKAFLRSWVNKKNGKVQHQLVATIAYEGAWRYYDAAMDEQGKSLFFVSIEHSLVGDPERGSEMEAFGAIIDDATLRRLARDGGSYAVTFKAKSGDADTVIVTAEMAAKQLAAVANFKPGVAMK